VRGVWPQEKVVPFPGCTVSHEHENLATCQSPLPAFSWEHPGPSPLVPRSTQSPTPCLRDSKGPHPTPGPCGGPRRAPRSQRPEPAPPPKPKGQQSSIQSSIQPGAWIPLLPPQQRGRGKASFGLAASIQGSSCWGAGVSSPEGSTCTSLSGGHATHDGCQRLPSTPFCAYVLHPAGPTGCPEEASCGQPGRRRVSQQGRQVTVTVADYGAA